MSSLYDRVSDIASASIEKLANEVSTIHHPVRVWDGMELVWILYETYTTGRVEAWLDLKPANSKMFGNENIADEFLFTVGVRAWHGNSHQPFWSSSIRSSRIVEEHFSEEELENWIRESVTDAFERASREM